jgi:hypothetical protein
MSTASTGIIEGLRQRLRDLDARFEEQQSARQEADQIQHKEIARLLRDHMDAVRETESARKALVEIKGKLELAEERAACLEEDLKVAAGGASSDTYATTVSALRVAKSETDGKLLAATGRISELEAALEAANRAADSQKAQIVESTIKASDTPSEATRELDRERQQHALTKKQLLGQRKLVEAYTLTIQRLEGKRAMDAGSSALPSVEQELRKALEENSLSLQLVQQRDEEIAKMRALLHSSAASGDSAEHAKAAQMHRQQIATLEKEVSTLKPKAVRAVTLERDLSEARDKIARLSKTCK